MGRELPGHHKDEGLVGRKEVEWVPAQPLQAKWSGDCESVCILF